MKAPFIPVLNGSMDVTNFDIKFTSEEVGISPAGSSSLEYIKEYQKQFEDF